MKRTTVHYDMVQMPSFYMPEGFFRLAFEDKTSSDGIAINLAPDDASRLFKVISTNLPANNPPDLVSGSIFVSDGSRTFQELYALESALAATLLRCFHALGFETQKIIISDEWMLVQALLPDGIISVHFPVLDMPQFASIPFGAKAWPTHHDTAALCDMIRNFDRPSDKV